MFKWTIGNTQPNLYAFGFFARVRKQLSRSGAGYCLLAIMKALLTNSASENDRRDLPLFPARARMPRVKGAEDTFTLSLLASFFQAP